MKFFNFLRAIFGNFFWLNDYLIFDLFLRPVAARWVAIEDPNLGWVLPWDHPCFLWGQFVPWDRVPEVVILYWMTCSSGVDGARGPNLWEGPRKGESGGAIRGGAKFFLDF